MQLSGRGLFAEEVIFVELFGLIVTIIFVLLVLAAIILPRFEERQSEE